MKQESRKFEGRLGYIARAYQNKPSKKDKKWWLNSVGTESETIKNSVVTSVGEPRKA